MYSATFWVIFALVAAFVFILPTLIGVIRGVNDLGLVIVLNLLGLVTLAVGWIGAMLVACLSPKKPPRHIRGGIYDPGSLF